jgi:pimeloyl-ACP methyl ester carboxylesterase
MLSEAMARFQRDARHGRFETERSTCTYYTWGNAAGPCLVCVPGLADDSRSFVPLVAHLSQRFRCIAYDWPAGGANEPAVRHYRHADFVADFLALLDHLGIEQALPVGYSFGSTVVLEALRRQPARFPRAVLIGGFAKRRLAPAELLLASMARYWPGRVRQLPLVEWVLRGGRREAFDRRDPDIWQYYLERNGSLPMAALAQRALVLDRVDLRPVLPGITHPILMICGDGDPMVGKLCEAELLTGLPRIARAELTQCGHLSIYTHSEVVAEIATEFFISTPEMATCG